VPYGVQPRLMSCDCGWWLEIRTLWMKCRGSVVVVEAIGGIPEESVCGGFDVGLGGLPSRDWSRVIQCVGEEYVLR